MFLEIEECSNQSQSQIGQDMNSNTCSKTCNEVKSYFAASLEMSAMNISCVFSEISSIFTLNGVYSVFSNTKLSRPR